MRDLILRSTSSCQVTFANAAFAQGSKGINATLQVTISGSTPVAESHEDRADR